MANNPIEKNIYPSPSLHRDPTGLKAIYQYWLKDNNCRQLLSILSKHSRVDAILTSGNTNVLIEYKQRTMPVYKYNDGSLLERQKYESLMKASVLFDSPAVYLVDYTDAVVIFNLSNNENNYVWQKMTLPSENHNGILVEKPVTIIPFTQASIVIGKRTWKRASIGELLYHIEKNQ